MPLQLEAFGHRRRRIREPAGEDLAAVLLVRSANIVNSVGGELRVFLKGKKVMWL
jgi:hypothetical protein